MSQKLKLLENSELNHLTITLTVWNKMTYHGLSTWNSILGKSSHPLQESISSFFPSAFSFLCWVEVINHYYNGLSGPSCISNLVYYSNTEVLSSLTQRYHRVATHWPTGRSSHSQFILKQIKNLSIKSLEYSGKLRSYWLREWIQATQWNT